MKIWLCHGCCCGVPEKDSRFTPPRRPFGEIRAALKARLREGEPGLDGNGKNRPKDQIAVLESGCMGPCDMGNNAVVAGGSRGWWFHHINSEERARALAEFAQSAQTEDNPAVPDALIPCFGRRLSPQTLRSAGL